MPMMRILNRTVQQTSDPDFYKIILELSPSESVATTPIVTEGTATLHIGSASYLGLGADRQKHYFSDVGAARPTLVVGKQYRMVLSVIYNFVSPINGPDSMASFGVALSPTTGTPGEVDQPTYTWTPATGTFTTDLGYGAGPAWFSRAGHAVGSYGTGQVIVGEWVRFDGPVVTPDPYISGNALSGFYGFEHLAELSVQSRDVP